MRSEVARLAMARTRGASSAKSLSLSCASESLIRLNGRVSPLTMTGFGGPISSTRFSQPPSFAPIHINIVTGCSTRSLEGRQQLGAERAVDHAMIAGERHRHDAGEGDAAVRGLDRLPTRGADRQDGRLRRIDDGGELAHAVHAEIGDRRRAALIFARRELLRRARAPPASFISCEIAESVFVSACRITGVIRPPSIATATPMSECLKRRMRSSAHTAFARRHALQRRRPGLDDEVVDRELEARIAVLVLGRRRVGLFAQRRAGAPISTSAVR